MKEIAMTESQSQVHYAEEHLARFSARLQSFYDALPEDEKPLMQLVLREAGQPLDVAGYEQSPDDVRGHDFRKVPGGYGWFPGDGGVGIGGWKAPSYPYSGGGGASGGAGGWGGGRLGIVFMF
jgi:hypothetical protein